MAWRHLKQRLIDVGIPSEDDLNQFIHLIMNPTLGTDYATASSVGKKGFDLLITQNQQNFYCSGHNDSNSLNNICL